LPHPELIEAWPPAAPVARVAEQGAGEAKGRMGVSVPSSLGLGRQWSGGA
jgi:hypothetical protein